VERERERKRITASKRKIKREKIEAVIMVAGCAGLAHTTRLGPNSL